MLGGEGGRVSRGGANPELQGLPLQGEMAHEVVSGGSYTASNGLNPFHRGVSNTRDQPITYPPE